jgi:hypothetical protein
VGSGSAGVAGASGAPGEPGEGGGAGVGRGCLVTRTVTRSARWARSASPSALPTMTTGRGRGSPGGGGLAAAITNRPAPPPGPAQGQTSGANNDAAEDLLLAEDEDGPLERAPDLPPGRTGG